jgi:hypothetical protein
LAGVVAYAALLREKIIITSLKSTDEVVLNWAINLPEFLFSEQPTSGYTASIS